jgi:hypothetical protein
MDTQNMFLPTAATQQQLCHVIENVINILASYGTGFSKGNM